MNVIAHKRRRTVVPAAIGCALALLSGVASQESLAQQAAAPATAPGGTGWYGYVPGQGWVSYAPPSTPVPSPGTATYGTAPGYPGATTSTAPAAAPARGWAGYNPGPAWLGYAPASAGTPVVVRPAPSWTPLPSGTMRRRAAHEFVNGNATQYSHALRSYREMGTGRNVPLAKPWLPPSP